MIRLLVIACMFMTGCDTTNNASIDLDELANSRWLLDRAETDTGNVSAPAASEPASAIEFGDFDADRGGYLFSGYNGCNAFSGLYELTQSNSLRFFNIAQTKRACNEEQARLEYAFSRGLEGATRFTVENDQLVIEAPSRNVNLVFVRSRDVSD